MTPTACPGAFLVAGPPISIPPVGSRPLGSYCSHFYNNISAGSSARVVRKVGLKALDRMLRSPMKPNFSLHACSYENR